MKTEKNTDSKNWLTKKDIMKYLSASQRTVENWTNQGLIKSYRLGGRVFFDQAEVDDDIKNSRNGNN